jgi:hypothetical protein
MSRVLRIGWLVLSAVIFCSRPADAGLADWLEQLSGAGSFGSDGLANFVSNVVCLTPKITLTQDDKERKPCLYADFHKFINHDDDEFYKADGQEGKELRATAYALGVAFQPSKRLHTDVGADVGRITFHTSETDTGHWTLGARAQVKPLLFIEAFEKNARFIPWRKWASVPKAYVRRSVILGTISGAKDFAATGSGAAYERKNEGVWSCGILLDFSELLRPSR